MSTGGVMLHVFSYGEDREGPQRRSLGFRLLVPVEPEPWSTEVETLARRLQAALYPDHWPPTDLFCSVLLTDGRRLIAVARYGLIDHTPAQRRGGLELIGVVGPGSLGVPSARAIYQWLRQQRAGTDDLHTLGQRVSLATVLEAVPPVSPEGLVWISPHIFLHENPILFPLTAPSDPDRFLRGLYQETRTSWQWLPLIGDDFPLREYAQRGPLVAWKVFRQDSGADPTGSSKIG